MQKSLMKLIGSFALVVGLASFCVMTQGSPVLAGCMSECNSCYSHIGVDDAGGSIYSCCWCDLADGTTRDAKLNRCSCSSGGGGGGGTPSPDPDPVGSPTPDCHGCEGLTDAQCCAATECYYACNP